MRILSRFRGVLKGVCRGVPGGAGACRSVPWCAGTCLGLPGLCRDPNKLKSLAYFSQEWCFAGNRLKSLTYFLDLTQKQRIFLK